MNTYKLNKTSIETLLYKNLAVYVYFLLSVSVILGKNIKIVLEL